MTQKQNDNITKLLVTICFGIAGWALIAVVNTKSDLARFEEKVVPLVSSSKSQWDEINKVKLAVNENSATNREIKVQLQSINSTLLRIDRRLDGE